MRSVVFAMAAIATGILGKPQPTALIYRGPAACAGCPEAIGQLLETSSHKFKVIYAGPDEEVQVNSESLSKVDAYAQAGGPDLDDAWEELSPSAEALRQFVSNGGRYLGFCLGAYIAGHTPGFSLLPDGVDADSEIDQRKSQVKHDNDTMIQVDWRFSTGPNAGKTEKGRWVYFQEGSVVTGIDPSSKCVLARYSSNGDVAATLTPYGRGWVGVVGPHPEATEEWYAENKLNNPDGIKFDIGYDFVEATMAGMLDHAAVSSGAARSRKGLWR